MTPFVIGNIQFILSLLIYALIATWYIYPNLRNKEWNKAITPLLFIHCFRYMPLTILMPGQVSENVPLDIAQTIAYGDLISGLLALSAVLMAWYKIHGARTVTWIFTLFGFGDVIVSSIKGVGGDLLNMPMGFNLYILNFYVPMIIVSHVLIAKILLKK